MVWSVSAKGLRHDARVTLPIVADLMASSCGTSPWRLHLDATIFDRGVRAKGKSRSDTVPFNEHPLTSAHHTGLLGTNSRR